VLKKSLRWLSRRLMKRSGADRLRAQGDRMRAAARFRDAGILYAAATEFMPDARTSVQAGHMFKEAGDWGLAEEQYLAALADLPDDADLALQLGHFYKVAGRSSDAITWYQRGVQLKPGWPEPLRELDRLGVGAGGADHPAVGRDGLVDAAPKAAALTEPLDAVVLRHFGSRSEADEPRGLAALKGVESIRGICVSAAPLTSAQLWVDGVATASTAVEAVQDGPGGVRKHVFNIWHDFSDVTPGPHVIEVRVADAEGGFRRTRRDAYVGAPLLEAEYPDSDGVVDGADLATDLTRSIRNRPSMVRPARGRFFAQAIGCIVVVRADQLGDMVVSVSALRRLRQLAPNARIVGVVTPANADLARSLGLFDAVETVTWDPSAPPGVRRLTASEEERVGTALRAYQPDVAIDLLVDRASRPLLALSGARHTLGFEDLAWPWLTVGVSGHSHDVRTGHEIAPHAARLLALVERFGTLLDSGSTIVPLQPGQPDGLAALRLRRGCYAVLHTGGRNAFTRWPGYPELVTRLLSDSDLDLVVFVQNAGMRASLPTDARVRIIDCELPFADFDALLEGAAVFVGNDSGPKHLAALRGTPVVSLHSARVDWREWGQTQTGVVISRRVPCAGCSIHGDQENECGRGYACITDISADEVFAAISAQLG
jgi:ADP-heptose:LPS heptosyltransferase